ncbi:MAG: archaetidylserine decarboxylase [Gammaproteobacteria bacterium]
MNLAIQKISPQHLISRFFGLIANLSFCPRLKNWAIKTYIRAYHIDMSEAQDEQIEAYPSFNHFFIRRLKPELRPIANGSNEIASPVDGRISQIGRITMGKLLQAKGFNYQLTDLLAGRQMASFENGYFATCYLSPKDYHRIHMPFTGTLQEMSYIPGKLFSVNPATVQGIDNLFARNERAVCIFQTEIGPMAIILVGAIIVAGMNTIWHGDIKKNKKIQHWQYNEKTPIMLQRGEEMGHFKLGSTVILLFSQSSQLQWLDNLQQHTAIKCGQLLAHIQKDKC